MILMKAQEICDQSVCSLQHCWISLLLLGLTWCDGTHNMTFLTPVPFCKNILRWKKRENWQYYRSGKLRNNLLLWKPPELNGWYESQKSVMHAHLLNYFSYTKPSIILWFWCSIEFVSMSWSRRWCGVSAERFNSEAFFPFFPFFVLVLL